MELWGYSRPICGKLCASIAAGAIYKLDRRRDHRECLGLSPNMPLYVGDAGPRIIHGLFNWIYPSPHSK